MEKLFLTLDREFKDPPGKMIDYRHIMLNLKGWTQSELSSVQRQLGQLETQHWHFDKETITLGRLTNKPIEGIVYTEVLIERENNCLKFSYNSKSVYVWNLQTPWAVLINYVLELISAP